MFIVFGKKAFYAIFALLLVLTAATVSLLLPPEAVETSVSAPTGKTVWVIDAGHGGEDGGAVAADGSKESDMNLAIARRLDALLVFLGEETRMTRTEDISIHDASASTLREKKRSDLENRVGLVNSTQGVIQADARRAGVLRQKRGECRGRECGAARAESDCQCGQ